MTRRLARRAGAFAPLLAAAAVAATAVGRAATTPRVVEFWVAAVPATWNVVPNGHDALGHMEYTPAQTTISTVLYQQFTKDFAKPVAPASIPGPVLHAQVGDTILVHFRNLDPNAPHSMHFHGVHYRPGSDGAYIPGISGPGADVKPGQDFTYRLVAGSDSAGVWPYHDHSPSMDESIAGGMEGVLSITARGARPPDHEFVVFLGQTDGFMTVDGRAFVGNTPVFRAKVGDTVQWDVLTLGDDFHTFHVHGHRWRNADGTVQDTKTIGPAESFAVTWKEDAPGTWLYHCHVESHMMNGMIGLYVVSP